MLILKIVCACPSDANVLKKCGHIKLLSPFLPTHHPFPTQTSALGPWNDRTAVPPPLPSSCFPSALPNILPSPAPSPSLKKVKGSCGKEIGRHQSSGGGRLQELFFAVTQIAQSYLALSSASENLPNPYPHSRPHLLKRKP